MNESVGPREAVSRAGRRAAYHLLQALVEGLKAVEAVIEEIGGIGEERDEDRPQKQRIEVE